MNKRGATSVVGTLLLVSTGACGGRDVAIEPSTPLTTDVDVVAEFLEIADGTLDPGFIDFGLDHSGWGRIVLTGPYEYDVRSTDSLVKPFEAEVVYEAIWYSVPTGETLDESHLVGAFTVKATFGYVGRWEWLTVEDSLYEGFFR